MKLYVQSLGAFIKAPIFLSIIILIITIFYQNCVKNFSVAPVESKILNTTSDTPPQSDNTTTTNSACSRGKTIYSMFQGQKFILNSLSSTWKDEELYYRCDGEEWKSPYLIPREERSFTTEFLATGKHDCEVKGFDVVDSNYKCTSFVIHIESTPTSSSDPEATCSVPKFNTTIHRDEILTYYFYGRNLNIEQMFIECNTENRSHGLSTHHLFNNIISPVWWKISDGVSQQLLDLGDYNCTATGYRKLSTGVVDTSNPFTCGQFNFKVISE